jgi:hypothetical protein
MLSQETAAQTPQIQFWPIDRLDFYARNPRETDAAFSSMPSHKLKSSWSDQGTQGRTANAPRFLETRKP